MKKLHIFTANFPTGFGESFLNNELPFLEEEFAEIKIYPYRKKEKIQKAFKNNHAVVFRSEQEGSLTMSDGFFLLKILLKEWFSISQKIFFLKNIRRFYAELKSGLTLAKWVDQQNLDPNDGYYSFWMNEWAMALAMLKKKKKINHFVFRVNGYDIYDERHAANYLPFRHFIYSQTTRVIPLSQTSAEYIRTKTSFKEKVIHAYFGTKDLGEVEVKENENFTVFTCSSAIPLKRLDKIAKVLCHISVPVKWVHHGEGATIEIVQKVLQEKGTHVDFKLSEKVEDYYEVIQLQKKLAPDVFINLSNTEGLPITIMETLSLGIPILVNEVGSCAEFVRPFTGILVSPEEEPEVIAKKMVKFIHSNGEGYSKDKIRDFWRENFSAKENYTAFAIELKKIFE